MLALIENWHTGEWVWASLATVLLVLGVVLIPSALRQPTSNRWSDRQAIAGLLVVCWAMAAACLHWGAGVDIAAVVHEVTWPSGWQLLEGVVAAFGMYLFIVGYLWMLTQGEQTYRQVANHKSTRMVWLLAVLVGATVVLSLTGS